MPYIFFSLPVCVVHVQPPHEYDFFFMISYYEVHICVSVTEHDYSTPWTCYCIELVIFLATTYLPAIDFSF
jgi:hypothetical protein